MVRRRMLLRTVPIIGPVIDSEGARLGEGVPLSINALEESVQVAGSACDLAPAT
jgi:hypothetical protein